MVVPEDFSLTGAYSLSMITELEKKRRTDNLTRIRRQLHDHTKSVGALLQLEVSKPEVAEQITQSVSSALSLLQTIKQFVPVLLTIDVIKYRRLVRAFNTWQNRDTLSSPSKTILSTMATVAKNASQKLIVQPSPENTPLVETPQNTSTPYHVPHEQMHQVATPTREVTTQVENLGQH